MIRQLQTSYRVDADGCWLWTGQQYTKDNGRRTYGRVARHRKCSRFSPRAHVAAYQYHKGPVPKGIFVCHHCDKEACVNPACLWLGTNQENQLDASRKGVFARYWTPERRAAKGVENSGEGNPMHGRRGKLAPCYGRTGKKHPMFGKHHTPEAKRKISQSQLRRSRP